MKVGDKVRFLSDIGGGRISGFQGKNIVLVEDADGFEIPTPMNEVVVVEDDDYSTRKVIETRSKAQEVHEPDDRSIKAKLQGSAQPDEPEEADEAEQETKDDPSVNFTPKPQERKGGDKLSFYLAFVPVDDNMITNTQFDAYVINDSNYFISYVWLTAEDASWTVFAQGTAEPNTKLRIETFGREQLNSMIRTCVQLFAFKRDKSFLLKPAVDVQVRIDAVKFFKPRSFQANDFFEKHALLYPIIENDRPVRPLVINASQLKQELYAHEPAKQKADVAPARTPEALVKRYDNNQSKSHKIKKVLRDDKLVIDLHASELLDSTVGMSSADILDYQMQTFRRVLEENKDKKGQKIVFIHGKGEGVLRHAIIHELNYRYKQYPYQDASFQEYGYGATQVTIK